MGTRMRWTVLSGAAAGMGLLVSPDHLRLWDNLAGGAGTRFRLAARVVVLLCGAPLPSGAAEVQRMTKEALLEILDQPETVVLEVRTGRDWYASEFKIKGVHRSDPVTFADCAAQRPKSATMVLYCA